MELFVNCLFSSIFLPRTIPGIDSSRAVLPRTSCLAETRRPVRLLSVGPLPEPASLYSREQDETTFQPSSPVCNTSGIHAHLASLKSPARWTV